MVCWGVCLSVQGVDVQAIIDDIRKLKIIVKGHERRIKSLEEQLALYDTHQQADYQWISITSVSCLSDSVVTAACAVPVQINNAIRQTVGDFSFWICLSLSPKL